MVKWYIRLQCVCCFRCFVCCVRTKTETHQVGLYKFIYQCGHHFLSFQKVKRSCYLSQLVNLCSIMNPEFTTCKHDLGCNFQVVTLAFPDVQRHSNTALRSSLWRTLTKRALISLTSCWSLTGVWRRHFQTFIIYLSISFINLSSLAALYPHLGRAWGVFHCKNASKHCQISSTVKFPDWSWLHWALWAFV